MGQMAPHEASMRGLGKTRGIGRAAVSACLADSRTTSRTRFPSAASALQDLGGASVFRLAQ
jgi:hypothetical protein